jgi:hypothetical protein
MITKLTKSQRYSMLSCTEYIVDGEDMHRRNWKLQLKSNIGRLPSDNLSLKLLQLQSPSASFMLLTSSGDSPNDLLGVCTWRLWALSCRSMAELCWSRTGPWPIQDLAHRSFFLLDWLGNAPISKKRTASLYDGPPSFSYEAPPLL